MGCPTKKSLLHLVKESFFLLNLDPTRVICGCGRRNDMGTRIQVQWETSEMNQLEAINLIRDTSPDVSFCLHGLSYSVLRTFLCCVNNNPYHDPLSPHKLQFDPINLKEILNCVDNTPVQIEDNACTKFLHISWRIRILIICNRVIYQAISANQL